MSRTERRIIWFQFTHTSSRYPEIFYTKSGDEFKERLWQETMDEFKFLDAWKIISDMKEGVPTN